MKKVFISFADDNMAYSLLRIGKLAKSTGIFSDIILYNPQTIPEIIRDSPLLKFSRGAGYWAWKPAIIWETLQRFEEGTIVVYCDAGNSVSRSDEWTTYFKLLEVYDTICFDYKDHMLEWEKFGQTSSKIKYWTKQSAINFFRNLLQDPNYEMKYNKIWGGALLVKGKENAFIKHWLDVTLEHPELIIDPTEEDQIIEKGTLAYHKHDQSIITPLAHYHNDTVNIMRETAETGNEGAIIGSRVRTKTKSDYYKLMFRNKLRKALGLEFYNTLKVFFNTRKRS